jgi:hypothetical protein
MSTHVVGFMPPDEDYTRKAKAWHACKDAGVALPPELERLFEHGPPDPNGKVVPLGLAACEWSNSYGTGFEVDVTKLPKGVRIIRFYNSW